MATVRRAGAGRRWLAALVLTAVPAIATASDGGEQLGRHALERINRERADQGLPPLALGRAASAAAQAHAEDMLRRGYYSHTSPSGETVRDRYIKTGGNGSRLTAENIARCQGCLPPPITASVDALHEGWMQSPLHRDNILRRGISEFGFGIAVDAARGLYAVQVFAGPGQPRDLQPGERPTALLPAEQLSAAVGLVNRLRKEAGQSSLASSPALTEAARGLIPNPSSAGFNLRGGELYNTLPEAERIQWRSLNVLGATCGGCGEAPTEADIRDFTQQWLQDERHRATLLTTTVTHLGFAMAADGDGKKTAVIVLGRRG